MAEDKYVKQSELLLPEVPDMASVKVIGNSQDTANFYYDPNTVVNLPNPFNLDNIINTDISEYIGTIKPLCKTSTPRFFSGTCNTVGGTAAKVVECPEYTTLTAGDVIFVKFTNTNTATVGSITLNVNSTGAKGIRRRYYTSSSTIIGNLQYPQELSGSQTLMFTYNGSNWILLTNMEIGVTSAATVSNGGTGTTTYYLMGTPSTIGTTLYRYGTNGPYMTGADLFAGSDLMYKKDITSITDDFVEKLFERDDITYDFKWKENDKQSSGFIAQWIEDIMPEMVDGKEGEKHVNYNAALSKTVGALFKKIKQQQKEIDELKELIKNK